VAYSKIVRHKKHDKHAEPNNYPKLGYKEKSRTGLWKQIHLAFLPSPAPPPHRGLFQILWVKFSLKGRGIKPLSTNKEHGKKHAERLIFCRNYGKS
jgi:hypothetical protein